jgi:hypothetical protein
MGRGALGLGLATALLLATRQTAWAIVNSLPSLQIISGVHTPEAEHPDQNEFTPLVASGQSKEAFTAAFEDGDELFETPFNALDGGGANVGHGQRHTRTPRADLNGLGEWATHFPARATGPNAQFRVECHIVPDQDGAGGPSANVTRDPGQTANLDMGPGLAESIDEVGTGASVFLTRNLWGVGSTAPYLHDGRATTLTEAILGHGGEGEKSRTALVALSPQDQQDLVAYLNNFVLYKQETTAPVSSPPTTEPPFHTHHR